MQKIILGSIVFVGVILLTSCSLLQRNTHNKTQSVEFSETRSNYPSSSTGVSPQKDSAMMTPVDNSTVILDSNRK